MIRQYLTLIIFFLLLAGCAQQIQGPNTAYPDWQQRLKKEQNWQVQGKLAFIGPEQRQSANLNWQHKSQHSKLILTSFIGTRILLLEQDKNGATLEFDGDTYTDTDANQLLTRLTGFTIPVSSAQQWLKGLSQDPDAQFDQQGRLSQLSYQANDGQTWLVTYGQYQLNYGYWLPTKITLKNHAIRIKVQLNNWQFK